MNELLSGLEQIATIVTPFALMLMTFFVLRNARRVEEKITNLEHRINLIQDTLVITTREAGHAAGMVEGRAAQRAEHED